MVGEIFNKVKDFLKKYEKDLFLAFTVIAVALVSFGLGRLSTIRERKTPIKIEYPAGSFQGASVSATNLEAALPSSIGASDKMFVASKNGAKYHFPWCSGAQSIKEENRIWFSSKEEAESKGYTPAANCKGL